MHDVHHEIGEVIYVSACNHASACLLSYTGGIMEAIRFRDNYQKLERESSDLLYNASVTMETGG